MKHRYPDIFVFCQPQGLRFLTEILVVSRLIHSPWRRSLNLLGNTKKTGFWDIEQFLSTKVRFWACFKPATWINQVVVVGTDFSLHKLLTKYYIFKRVDVYILIWNVINGKSTKNINKFHWLFHWFFPLTLLTFSMVQKSFLPLATY